MFRFALPLVLALGCFDHHPVESFEPIDAARDAWRDGPDADIRDSGRDARGPDARMPDVGPDVFMFDVGPDAPPDSSPIDVGPDVPPDVPVDAPPPIDARCDFVPNGDFGGLTCPDFAPAGDVEITVTANPGQCCDTGEATIYATPTADFEWEVIGEWEVCDCCAACGCLSPHVVRIVHLDMEPGLHTIRAGIRQCEILIE